MKRKPWVCALALFLANAAFAESNTEAVIPQDMLEAATKAVTPAPAPAPPATLQPIVIVQKSEQAPPPVTQAWWQLLLTELVKLISLVVGILMSGLIGVLAKKYNFQAQQAQVDFIAMQAIDYVEQMSLRKLKLEHEPIDSVGKLKLGIEAAKGLARDFKVKEKSEEFWTKTLEGWVRRKKEQQAQVPATEVLPPA